MKKRKTDRSDHDASVNVVVVMIFVCLRADLRALFLRLQFLHPLDRKGMPVIRRLKVDMARWPHLIYNNG